MLAADRDAVVCDLAETYGILDYRALPVRMLATLCVGLRDDSRIRLLMSGARTTMDTALLAAAADRLGQLVWMGSKDGQRGKNRPRAILPLLLGQQKRESDLMTFDTGEEFEAARNAALGVKQSGD